MQAWNIKQLYEALQADLAMCGNNLERSIATAIGGKELREKAQEFARQRKLTPSEVAIAEQFGYRA